MKALVSTCALAASLAFLPAAAHADLQPSCPAAEYVYAGAHLLAVVTPPTVSIGDASLTEGDGVNTLMTFPVALSTQSDFAITVNYATGTGGTAASGSDYALTSGTLTIPAGAPPPGGYSVSVAISADTIDEPNETFFVDLTIPGGCTVAAGDMQAQGTILDNDAPATISISDTTLAEGDEGSHPTSVGVGILQSGYTVTVNYATANGTATAPGDYAAKSGTLTFPPGTTILNILLSVVADGVAEPNETFYVNLSGATNATLSDSQGSLTIFNDDPAFVPSVELAPGAEEFADLRATGAPPTAAAHLYRMGQKPRSSYEVVVDSISGDVDNGFGIHLRRYAWDQTTLLDISTVVPSHSVNRRIRWTNTEFVPVNHQFIKVESSGCTTNCGADDVYRIPPLRHDVSHSALQQPGRAGHVPDPPEHHPQQLDPRDDRLLERGRCPPGIDGPGRSRQGDGHR